MKKNLLLILLLTAGYATDALAQAGILDTSFGMRGMVVSDAPIYGKAMTIQPDGKILTVGSISVPGGGDCSVVRHNPDGSVDTSFGVNGVSINHFAIGINNGLATAIAVQPDGKIVCTGILNNTFYFLRLNANGSLDTTLTPTYTFPMALITHKIAFMPDGSFVFAGATTYDGYGRPVVLKFSATGEMILYGLMENAFSGMMTDVLIQPDGKIIFCGLYLTNITTTTDYHARLVRFTTDGELDPTFGEGGYVVFRYLNIDTVPYRLLMQADGKLVVGGVLETSGFVARLENNGVADASFGANGMAALNVQLHVRAMGIEPSGNITIGGVIGNSAAFRCARVTANGLLDTSYNTDTTLQNLDHVIVSGTPIYGAMQQDGKLIVSSTVADNEGNFKILMGRYTNYATAGVNDNNASLISVYPNPVKDVLTINQKNGNDTYNLTVIDIAGKIIMQQDNASQINVAGLPAGMYFLKVTSAQKTDDFKFIKQ